MFRTVLVTFATLCFNVPHPPSPRLAVTSASLKDFATPRHSPATSPSPLTCHVHPPCDETTSCHDARAPRHPPSPRDADVVVARPPRQSQHPASLLVRHVHPPRNNIMSKRPRAVSSSEVVHAQSCSWFWVSRGAANIASSVRAARIHSPRFVSYAVKSIYFMPLSYGSTFHSFGFAFKYYPPVYSVEYS
ncbi:uncharacterized protein ARMOST_22516 [Armillaria ostoyae]|uniref:Uncharacterized protein n=1 Tax=Armillaria ostoyae TaxID=47428 RepID=A0A284SD21_ARMOS|nr:uncharacterized protein ARMOST_22516 [Armillaria ostoyae]